MDLNEVSDYLTLDNWESSYLEAMQVGGEQAAVPHGMTGRVPFDEPSTFMKPMGWNCQRPMMIFWQRESHLRKGIRQLVKTIGTHISIVGEFSLDLFIAQMLYNYTGEDHADRWDSQL